MVKKIKILLVIAVCICILTITLSLSGLIVLDHSAEFKGEYLYWNNTVYIECNGKYTEGKTLAKTSHDNISINSVKEDDSYTFIVVRSFLAQHLYVRENYIIPEEGEITTVFWNNKKITDSAFCQTMRKIYVSSGNTFEYETEGIYMLTETQHMKELYFAYENCPIATCFIGYMGKVNDRWVIASDISTNMTNENGSPEPYKIICREIPDDCIPELEKYFD